MTNEERAALAERARELYEKPLTVVQVADELRCSYGKAYALIKEAEGEIRPRGRIASSETT